MASAAPTPMSDTSEGAAPDPTSARAEHGGPAAAAPVALDEVMLAMDVVDTLRHERALVETALDEDARAQQLTARVREIYASQGIDVPDEVIAQGVEALRQDRFRYVPPERTFAVRVAELWVERGKWGRRAGIVAGIGLLVWALIAIPSALSARAQVDAYRARLAHAEARVADLRGEHAELTAAVARARAMPGGAAVSALLDEADADLAATLARIDELAAASAAPPDGYAEDPRGYDRAVAARLATAQAVGTDLGRVRGRLDAFARLASVPADLARETARLAGVEVEPAAARELAALRAAVESAVAAADAGAAAGKLHELRAFVDELDRSYELRIVSREGVSSGIWRHPDGNRSARNHYIVVEAIDADGKPVALPITSEETGRTQRTERFAVRVPEAVYEAVKADKLDNGIVDRRHFGTKRRGAKDVEWLFEVAGGAITEW